MSWRTRIPGGLLALVVIAGCSGGRASDSADSPPSSLSPATTVDATNADAASTTLPDPPVAIALRPLHTEGGEAPAFVDDLGRQVLLRGVNVNALGDYYQADPALPPVTPLTAADWDDMAAQGFSVVRLIVSWSRLEPERGTYDDGYIAELQEAVDAAGARGIYVVLDMHQDAWGKSIATPEGVECPEGLEPAIGWDGAPAWATITDEAETCRNPGSRESSMAVRTAFQSFYDDREGIRSAFVDAWGHLAGAFADDPAVAGYDLFNEPNVVEAPAALQPKYTELLDELISTIRTAETEAGGLDHIVFIEPLLLFPSGGTVPPPGFTDDTNLAFAPHNYWEAITTGLFTIEQGFGLDEQAARGLDMPFWVGEYGWWDTEPETLERVRRYAAAEDEYRVGGAWWQWRQACGDPHSVGVPGNEPGDQVHLRTVTCPDDADIGLTEEFAVVLARAYPRAAPGRLTSLVSDPDARTLSLSGRAEGADPDASLVVWIPTAGRDELAVGGEGIADVEVEFVDGGHLVTATVGCEYTLEVDGPDGATTSGSTEPCAG
jgi:endoglycosylceramidase